jgi:hypothetical protein
MPEAHVTIAEKRTRRFTSAVGLKRRVRHRTQTPQSRTLRHRTKGKRRGPHFRGMTRRLGFLTPKALEVPLWKLTSVPPRPLDRCDENGVGEHAPCFPPGSRTASSQEKPRPRVGVRHTGAIGAERKSLGSHARQDSSGLTLDLRAAG